MTYGEACIAEKESLELIKGVWKQTLHIKHKPNPMKRKEAVKYYNKKLFDYWSNTLSPKLKPIRKHQITSLFMFGHVDRYKQYMEES